MGTSEAYLRAHPELRDEDRTSATALAVNAWASAPLAAYFRFRMSGWENLPEGPCVVAANHGIASPFVLPLLARALHRDGGGRSVRGMMHRVAYQFPFRQIGVLQRLGGVYAHPDVGRAALRGGRTVLVFPGGDADAFRPFARRNRPDFDGRSGFVRLARAERVPIVPLAISGSQATCILLPGAAVAGRLLGLKRWTGLDRFPVTLGLAGLAATLLAPPLWPLVPFAALAAIVPLPSRIEARLLPAIDVDEAAADEHEAERVRAAIEAALCAMARRRKTPWG